MIMLLIFQIILTMQLSIGNKFEIIPITQLKRRFSLFFPCWLKSVFVPRIRSEAQKLIEFIKNQHWPWAADKIY